MITHTNFIAELISILLASSTPEEKDQVLEDAWKKLSAVENRMREDLVKLHELRQAKFLNSLGEPGCCDRGW